jgi:formate hydrogenlyase subunit 6/NADH:ubiquinone oxidoreductase subunit I
VNPKRCISCGLCVKTCPRNLIELKPVKNQVAVRCSSREKGAAVRNACTAGCIGCGLCEKQCRFDAIHVTEHLAHVDYDKCTQCGACSAKCPAKVITMTDRMKMLALKKTAAQNAGDEEGSAAKKDTGK